jgi:hypothetical protein
MLNLIAGLAGAVILIVLVFVTGLLVIRRTSGQRAQTVYMGVGQFIGAALLDCLLLYFSITFSTAALSDAVRMRGSGTQNAVLTDLADALGGTSPDAATLWGLLIPFLSWVAAHGVALCALLVLRYGYAWLRMRRPAEGMQAAPVDFVAQLGGTIVGLVVFVVFFVKVVAFDCLLIRYQMINSSTALRKALGKGWESSMSQDVLIERLSSTFYGQIVVHAGDFYVVALLMMALVMVIASHNLMRAISLTRRRAYVVPPPPPLGAVPPLPAAAQGPGAAPPTGGVPPPIVDLPEPPPPPRPPDPPGGGGNDLPPLVNPPPGQGPGNTPMRPSED